MANVERLAPRQQWNEENGQGGSGATVTVLPRPEVGQHLRIVEAVLFAASEPLAEPDIARRCRRARTCPQSCRSCSASMPGAA